MKTSLGGSLEIWSDRFGKGRHGEMWPNKKNPNRPFGEKNMKMGDTAAKGKKTSLNPTQTKQSDTATSGGAIRAAHVRAIGERGRGE